MCAWFDETCGELIDFIDHRGLTNSTLYVYLGDNGWIQNPDSSSYAPRSKQSPNEGGVRQPIMLSWPGVIRPGPRDERVSSIDLAPTILSAAGAKIPEHMPGLDLLPLVRDGQPLDRGMVFGESFAHDIADIDNPEASLIHRWAIQGEWKLLLTYDGVLGRYASTHPRTETRPQLFDLLADPHEESNLAAEHPEIVERMSLSIAQWWPVTERKCLTRWTE
jgi:uncharacterized sulfatase